MHMKTAIGVVAALAVVAGAFYSFGGTAQAPFMETQGVNWSFREMDFDAQGTPHTEVSVNGKAVGTFAGDCAEIDGASWTLAEGETSGVICWWAGGGKEIGVFEGNIVKVGDLEEGSAETSGFRGNYKTIFEL